MVLIRYICYFVGVALITGLLAYSEIIAPGGLKLHIFTGPGDTLGTSEYSPVETIQHGILIVEIDPLHAIASAIDAEIDAVAEVVQVEDGQQRNVLVEPREGTSTRGR